MEAIKFNHDAKTISLALGISEDRKLEIEACVMYAILSTEIIANKLYGDDRNNAPNNMRSKSGVLEKILDYAFDEAELVYMAYEYASTDKFTNTKEGKLFATALAIKLEKDLELDEEKFISWWKQMRTKDKKKSL